MNSFLLREILKVKDLMTFILENLFKILKEPLQCLRGN